VAGEVDDFAPVVVADRGLLVIEDAQLEVCAFGAQVVECGGEVSELWARGSLRHGVAPQRERIAERQGLGTRDLGRGNRDCGCGDWPGPQLGWVVVRLYRKRDGESCAKFCLVF